ncbi:MAG: putative glycoside hydrolase [Spirochaetes bacterium]|nr:putative glycoside hydrolase [Spirochaetota bacterium]
MIVGFLLLCCLSAFGQLETGWKLAWSTLLREDFSTLSWATGPQCLIAEGGSIETEQPLTGNASLVGRSAGERSYLPCFQTRPEKLPLARKGTYLLTFTYRILEPGDKGFEALFYSPLGGSRNQWVRSTTVNGQAGTRGTARLEATLFDYSDYRVLINVVGKGAIEVDAIRLYQDNRQVLSEDFERQVPGPGLGFRLLGGGTDETGWLRLEEGQKLVSNPSVLALPPMSVFKLSFDYRLLSPGSDAESIRITLLPTADSRDGVGLRPLLRNAVSAGRFVTGFTTGSRGPYVISLDAGRGAKVLLDTIVVERGEPETFTEKPASYAYLGNAPFPRLGNYTMISPREQVEWDGFERQPWRSSVEEIERRLALFDVIFGFDTPSFDPGFPDRIKALNPNAVLLPYVIATELHLGPHQLSAGWADPDGEPGIRFDRGLSPQWFVRDSGGKIVDDPDYPGILKLDISDGCPRVNGKSFVDYAVEGFRREYLQSGIWDGLFIDNLFARMTPHIPNAWIAEKIDFDINRNGRRDETLDMLHEMYRDAAVRLMAGLRAGTGNRELIIGNAGPLPETRMAPFANGYVFEGYSGAWDGFADSTGKPSEPAWRRAFDDYSIMDSQCLLPRVNVVEACGRHDSFKVPDHGAFRITDEDIRRNRFALGTTLLRDAFYEYDLTESRSSIAWFDEFAVDFDGVARESATGKGYLGRALGPARELGGPGRQMWSQDFEGAIPQSSVAGWGTVRLSSGADETIQGARSLVVEQRQHRSDASSGWVSPELQLRKGVTYLFRVTWKALTTLDFDAVIEISGGSDKSRANLPARFAGETGRIAYPFTALADGAHRLSLFLSSAGRMAFDDIAVMEAGAGPWRRDFENGIVVVNPLRATQTIGVPQLAGDATRTGIRRIRGTQAPEVNSGAPVTDALVLEPFDAIVLLADHVEAGVGTP